MDYDGLLRYNVLLTELRVKCPNLPNSEAICGAFSLMGEFDCWKCTSFDPAAYRGVIYAIHLGDFLGSVQFLALVLRFST